MIEASLSMAIVGIMLASILHVLRHHQRMAQMAVTRQNQELITEALVNYAIQRGFLPCPSNYKNFGVALPFCRSQDRSAMGIVPFLSLGLPERVAKDGRGNWITYAVDPYVVSGFAFYKKMVCAVFFHGSRVLDVKIGNRSVNLSLGGRDGVAFVLISHGPSGGYFFGPKGDYRVSVRKNLKSYDTKIKNTGPKGIPFYFYASPSKKLEDFDDNVFWMTRGNMLQKMNIKCPDLFFQ